MCSGVVGWGQLSDTRYPFDWLGGVFQIPKKRGGCQIPKIFRGGFVRYPKKFFFVKLCFIRYFCFKNVYKCIKIHYITLSARRARFLAKICQFSPKMFKNGSKFAQFFGRCLFRRLSDTRYPRPRFSDTRYRYPKSKISDPRYQIPKNRGG